jgi:tyrosine-protein kinase Etk/Wzc
MTQNNQKLNFIDFLLIIKNWRRVFIISTIIIGVIAVIVSLLLPKYYKSTVLFLPPTSSSGLTSLLENFSVDILGGEEITGEVCVTVLNSRELREELIRKYNLMQIYKKKYIEHALKAFNKKVSIDIEQQVGIGSSSITSISITVEDKSPERAANIANDFYDLLQEKIIFLNTQKAKENRIFLEQKVEENLDNLKLAEDSLASFQKTNGAIEVTAQAKAAIEAAAGLKAEIIKTKIEKQIVERDIGKNNSQSERLANRLNLLMKEYHDIHFKNDFTEDSFIAINDLPSVGMMYYRLFRNVEIMNKIHEMLLPMLEQAKIKEAKTIPILRIVDKAVPATYKFKPKRALIVISILFVNWLFLVVYIFISEYLRILKDEDFERYSKIMRLFNRD